MISAFANVAKCRLKLTIAADVSAFTLIAAFEAVAGDREWHGLASNELVPS
jgi:hypothetical protein